MKARILLAGVFALLAECAVANALTTATETELINSLAISPQITFDVSNNGAGNVSNTNTGPRTPSQNLTFDRFNPTLGNLTGVTITFTTVYGATATVNATNNNLDQVTFSANATIAHSLTGIGLIMPQSAPSQTFSASCAATATENPFDDPTPGSCTDSQPNGTTFINTTGIGLAPGADFRGPPGSTFILTAELSAALAPDVDPDNSTNINSFADNSTFGGTLTGNWTGSVSLFYTYEPFATAVPEPLSLYLLLAGLGGIALWRRRR